LSPGQAPGRAVADSLRPTAGSAARDPRRRILRAAASGGSVDAHPAGALKQKARILSIGPEINPCFMEKFVLS